MLKKPLKNALFFYLHHMNPRIPERRASILMYHSVDNNEAFFTVRPNAFERQLRYLAEKDFHVVPLSELVRKLNAGEDITNHVSLTFDDGYRDNYDIAFPLLKKYDIPATFFLVTEFLGASITTSKGVTLDVLDPAQIQEMKESGLCEFMPHEAHHQTLDNVRLDQASQMIEASRKDVEKLTDARAAIFSFPKGRYTPDLIDYLEEHDWDGAVTVGEGLVKAGDNPYTLKRNSIDSMTSFIQFKGKLSGAIDRYCAFKKQ